MTLLAVSCSDVNKHQFALTYEDSAILTVDCGNCLYYTGSYSAPQENVIKRTIDSDSIELFTNIKFCEIGDTTPDGWLRIETDTGSVASFGILFPNQEHNSELRIQSEETGLGRGCSRKDQMHFEKFFDVYASKESL